MIRSAYSPKERKPMTFPDSGKTVQYFKAECDINNVIAKYSNTGALWTTRSRPQYGDFADIGDYKECLDRVQRANESFSALPADIRERFGNDPAKFVEYCSNQDNLEELRRMGLAPEAQQIPTEILEVEATELAE